VVLNASTKFGIASSYPPDQFERDMRFGAGAGMEIILKITERCNIACTYCYFFFAGDESYKSHPAYIHDDVVDGLARFLSEGRRSYDLRRVRLILHGGEPLLLKKSRMTQLLVKIGEACSGMEFQVTLQTNAMLVDEEWIEIFKQHRVTVGVSLDGPKWIHDKYRVDKRGRGTYDRVLQGVRLLQNAHSDGRLQAAPGLLAVINPEFTADEIYHHCIKTLSFKNVDFLLPDLDHNTRTKSEIDKITKFVSELLTLYRQELDAGVKVRIVDSALRELRVLPIHASLLQRFLSQKEIVFVVASSGEIQPEDVLRTTDPDLMNTGLNVITSTLKDLLLSPALARLNDLSYSVPADCMSCNWVNVCRGGILYHRYSSDNGFNNCSVHCESLKTLYSGACETLMLAGGDFNQLNSRLAKKPSAII